MASNINMIYFKNELLSDIKKIENTFNNKFIQMNNLIKTNSEEYNAKFTQFSNVISELIEIVSRRKHDNEKMEELFQMKNNIWTHINDHQNRILVLTKDLENAIFKYDRIIIDNLELPGIIGNRSKFKNLRELLEHIYSEMKSEQLFREEQSLGNKKYKERVEALINNLSMRSKEIYQACSNICTDKLKSFENEIYKRCETTEGLMDNLRVENSKIAIELKTKVAEIKIDWERLRNIKNETYSIINREIKKFDEIVEKNNSAFNEYKNQFKLIKQKFTQLSEFIKDVRFQKNIVGPRRHSVFTKEANNINFKKKQEYQKDYDENIKIGKSLFFYEKNGDTLNESYDTDKNKIKNTDSSIFSSRRKKNHFSAINLTYKDISPTKVNDTPSKNNLEVRTQKKIRGESNIILEINGSKKNVKNLKTINNSNLNSIKKEIELNILADSMNSVSSSSISDKNEEFYPNTERNEEKNISFKNLDIKNNINIDENKNDKIEEKSKNNEEVKIKEEIGKKLKLKSLELMAIESSKKLNKVRKISENIEKNNYENYEINEYSNLKFIRDKKSHKTDYFRLKGKTLLTDIDINSEKTINQKEKKLLLTELTQCNRKDDINNNESEKKKLIIKSKKNSEDNNYYEQSKTSRPSSIAKRKISFNTKDDEDYNNNIKSNKNNFNKIFSNKKLDVYDNYINKNEENINKILFKIVFLQNKYIPLIKKINDLFNMFKNLNSKVIENKISITQLQKNNKDENCSTQNNDYKIFSNKTSRGRNNRYSLEIKHKMNKNYIKKMDNFDVSYKSKLPNDEANIILRRIEPFLIKEFKKKKV